MRLLTERLLLRDLAGADAEALHAVERDPETVRLQSYEPRDLDACRAYLAADAAERAAVPRRLYDLAVTRRDDGRTIGRCGMRLDERGAQASLWYVLLRAEWGRGLASEAARALVDHGFRALRLHRVTVECDPENVGSCRVAKKLGMRREAHHLRDVHLKGAWRDTLVHAVLAEEWLAARP